MKFYLSFCFALFFTITISAQESIKNLNPKLGYEPDLSPKAQKEFERREEILEKLRNGIEYEELSQKEKELIEEFDETIGSIWDIIGGGCSWYCGGGPYKILASSQLSAYKDIDYKPENAHDLSFKSAWVEGVEGYGIGEYIEYYFENQSARITNIIIYNGYVKSERLWKTNSRVKKLKLYINDIPYAILNLEDSRSAQKFDIDTLGQRDDGKDLVLRFEIIEAYPGTKYEDVAITEIYFDGIDVHCLIAGTLIKMSNGSDKLIEKLEIGDDILTYDLEHNKLLSTKITRLDSIIHCNLIEYNFADKSKIVATDEHPFLLKDKGWSSYNPDQSKKYQYFSAIQKIEIGDTFKKLDLNANLKDIKLLKIQVIHESQMTYTISGLENNLIFIANGFLVGIEELRDTNLSIR